MKRGLLFLLILLLTITPIFALELNHDPIENEALPGNKVSYVLHFNNNEQTELQIKIKSVDLNWILDQKGLDFTLVPGQTKDVEVAFSPLPEERILPGSYGISLIADTQTTRLERILPALVVAYDKVINVDFATTAVIDPRRGAILRLTIENNNKVVLNDMNLDLSSQHFQFTKTFTLNKKESTILEFPVRLAPETIKGDYSARVKVNLDSNTLVDKDLLYKIQEYEDLHEVTLPQQGFLLGGEIVTQTNEGNTPISNTIPRQFSWLSYKLTSFNPEPTRVTRNDEGFLVEWDLILQPQQTATVAYIINYRLLVLIILIIIAAFALWYNLRKRSVIILDKRVLAMHTETGSVRVIKIILNVRNRGATTVNNVRVVDRVPSTIKTPTQYGMLKPMHVKATPQGTAMVWDFASIRPKEEKIISYRLEGKIHILGKIILPNAITKYVLFGRAVTARSQSVSLREKKH